MPSAAANAEPPSNLIIVLDAVLRLIGFLETSMIPPINEI